MKTISLIVGIIPIASIMMAFEKVLVPPLTKVSFVIIQSSFLALQVTALIVFIVIAARETRAIKKEFDRLHKEWERRIGMLPPRP